LTSEEEKLVRYCKFYMALQINEILKETPISKLSLSKVLDEICT